MYPIMSRHLNPKQILTLTTILKFRYVTTDNLASFRGITQNSAYSTLQILNSNGYVGKIYEKSYHLLNKSARYCLTAQAIEYLRDEVKLKLPNAVWNSYKHDVNRSPDFVDQQVAIHAAYNNLTHLFGKDATIHVPFDLRGSQDVIRPLPSLFVELKSGKRCFVELTDGQHLFIAKKRVRQYITHYDSNDWEWENYPDVYFLRASAADRSKLRAYITEKMEDGYLDDDDFSFHVVKDVAATAKQLLS